MTAPSQVSAHSMDRGLNGKPATPWASYPRVHGGTTKLSYSSSHEHEMIAILETLIQWEERLLGCKFIIVTDHKSLEYFVTQPNLSSRQTRWWEYLSQF